MLIFDGYSNMDVSQFLDEDFGLRSTSSGPEGRGGERRGEIGAQRGE